MRKVLSIAVLSAAMTVALAGVASAADIYTPGVSAGCVGVTSGKTSVTPGGGVQHSGDNVTVAPVGTCV